MSIDLNIVSKGEIVTEDETNNILDGVDLKKLPSKADNGVVKLARWVASVFERIGAFFRNTAEGFLKKFRSQPKQVPSDDIELQDLVENGSEELSVTVDSSSSEDEAQGVVSAKQEIGVLARLKAFCESFFKKNDPDTKTPNQ